MKAVLVGSTKIALVHNHPSGTPVPSKNDIQITSDIKNMVSTYGVYLFDNIVIGKDNSYYSILKPTKDDIKEGIKTIHASDFYKDTANVDNKN